MNEETITTRDDAELRVRPMAPSDRAALARNFRRLSAETRYRRFLAPVKALSPQLLSQLTDVDHHDHEALIALASDGEIVGVARYIRLDDREGVAEVAVTIADAWQARGVGTALLSRLIVHAEAEEIETFVASCLAENGDMITLFRELGGPVRQTASGAGVVELEISLPTDAEHLVRPALRAAATAPSLIPASTSALTT